MSVPDSHASIFTRIPESIEKIWAPQTRLCSTGAHANEASTHHSISTIKRIKLQIEFHEEVTREADELTEADDENDDRIAVWQDARKDWAILEEKINDAIKTIAIKQFERAQEENLKTIDVLRSYRTIPSFRPSYPNPTHHYSSGSTIRPPSTLISKRVRTLHPHESASQFDHDQMRSMIEGIIRSNSHESKTKKSKVRDKQYVDVRRSS